uniref:TSA: Wollemia nobilis Ref_Wollemi_Transcript_19516_1598 transcribed RNA sequence n=1 Tax=Wollemia nobilis TaxID=56998 RepID=A0A0C9RHW7_9CONI
MNTRSSVSRGSISGRPSLFQKDLLSPSPLSRSTPQKHVVFSTPAQAAAATALLNGGSETPPPPNFTLDERLDSSPEIMTPWDYTLASPESRSPQPNRSSLSYMNINGGGTPTPNKDYSSAMRSSWLGSAPMETSTTAPTATQAAAMPLSNGFQGAQQDQGSGAITSNWWPLMKAGEKGERVVDVSGMVQQPQQSGGLLTLPPPREIVRPDIQKGGLGERLADEEEWVTVFGFSPSDTNLVLREFEKCGIILKHVPGPGDANWMHILYQNHYDAQKALQKNGMQINGILIVGVKHLDPYQRLALSEKPNTSYMILPPQSQGRALSQNPSTKALPRSYHLQSNDPNQRGTSAMASPSKSTISKLVDLLFGV